jgi:dihydroorotate dehydrogenase
MWGLQFSSPLGLAAGFDKNGEVVNTLAGLGFGFAEIGTVTPRPQVGNPRPRLFRYPKYQSLQNCLGFNNQGMVAVEKNLRRLHGPTLPLGINVGKNRDTPIEKSAEDYLAVLSTLAGSAAYFVINVSSPNTPGLRDLQNPHALTNLLRRLRRATGKPLLVKLAPDLGAEQALEIAQIAVSEGADGLVLTNTTTDYSLIPGVPKVGGLSGKVLAKSSSDLLRTVASGLRGQCPIISVGGIASADDAAERLRLGASLVQLYTAMIFQGPSLIRSINRGLLEILDQVGADSIQDLRGVDLKDIK